MGGGYSAWVDSGLTGDKPPEELKLLASFALEMLIDTPYLYIEAKAFVCV